MLQVGWAFLLCLLSRNGDGTLPADLCGGSFGNGSDSAYGVSLRVQVVGRLTFSSRFSLKGVLSYENFCCENAEAAL